MRTESRIEQVATIASIIFLVVGCFVVLRPFVSALMWAAILCYVTWPVYIRLENMFKGKRTVASGWMTFFVVVIVVLPLTLIALSLSSNIKHIILHMQGMLRNGPPSPPSWVGELPWIGPMLESQWMEFLKADEGSHGLSVDVIKQVIFKSKGWIGARFVDLGQGIFQIILSVFIAFFFYRDGALVVERLHDATKRIAGDRTQHLLSVVGGTVKGVVYGILGTALAQGTLAGLGFWFCGVPLPFLLGLLTFFLSLVPMGPPIVWLPATIWLFYNDHMGHGIFSLVWGFFVVSGVDNILKPYLISRGSNLPFILVFLGVLGGVIAFGFIGIFLGPILLAVGYTLLQEWSAKQPEGSHAQGG